MGNREGGQVSLGSRVSEARGVCLPWHNDHRTPELSLPSQLIDLKQGIYQLSVSVTLI